MSLEEGETSREGATSMKCSDGGLNHEERLW